MDFFNDFIKAYWHYLVIAVLCLLLAFSAVYIFYFKEDIEEPVCETLSDVPEEVVEEEIYVDLKGAVKNPGVYKVDHSSLINDVIKLAGGLNKNAYTKNINLSKKVIDEMVIYVFSKSEYKDLHKEEVALNTNCIADYSSVDSCIEEGSSIIINNTETINSTTTNNDKVNDVIDNSNNIEIDEKSKKISINTASKDELMKLNGVGEAKAESIIKYREEVGLFKSIEDIKNVSGIGEAAFEKIKDNITI